MKVTKEICSFDELWEQSWGGAMYTLKTIKEKGLENDLMNHLEELYYEGTDEEALNDYLWFDRDEIYSILEIEEE